MQFISKNSVLLTTPLWIVVYNMLRTHFNFCFNSSQIAFNNSVNPYRAIIRYQFSYLIWIKQMCFTSNEGQQYRKSRCDRLHFFQPSLCNHNLHFMRRYLEHVCVTFLHQVYRTFEKIVLIIFMQNLIGRKSDFCLEVCWECYSYRY